MCPHNSLGESVWVRKEERARELYRRDRGGGDINTQIGDNTAVAMAKAFTNKSKNIHIMQYFKSKPMHFTCTMS